MTDKLLDDLKHALGDAYTIERELTGGGMSRVFVAREHALGREVVIKVLPPDLAAGVNRERFRREVQMAARLSHPYIVPLLHAGEHGELLWFTMPYIAGESLRTTIERKSALPITEVVKLLHDVVEALAYAHSRGVIHRDIKPANILTDGHHALVTDFGVAKALSAALPSMGAGHTTSGMAIGTPAYMAPEQLAADPAADHRMDIYAVGLLAYELLTGESPFSAPSPTATMTAQLTRIPEPLHKMRPEVPPALSALVQHCLAKAPNERPADARAILTELDKISGAIAADVHRGGTGVVVPPPAPRWPLVIAAFAVIGLVVGGIWYATRPPKTITKYAPVAVDDTSDLNALPLPQTQPLTHADSLRIAVALRDELAQLDSKAAAKRDTRKNASADTIALERQLALTDSLIRVQFEKMRREPGPGFRQGGPPMPSPTTGASGAMVGAPPSAILPSAPKRVLVMSTNWPRSDSAERAISAAAAAELTRRLGNSTTWTVIKPDSMQFRRERAAPGARGTSFAALDSIDMVVWISVQKDQNDSSYLSISIRNTAPGSSHGNQIITSNRVMAPTSLDQFRGTVRDASRTLEYLRNLPAGSAWPSTVPRQGGRGGPSDYLPPEFQRGMEQFRRFDSGTLPKPPKMPGSASGG